MGTLNIGSRLRVRNNWNLSLFLPISLPYCSLSTSIVSLSYQ